MFFKIKTTPFTVKFFMFETKHLQLKLKNKSRFLEHRD